MAVIESGISRALAQKLGREQELQEGDLAALQSLSFRCSTVGSRESVITEGDPVETLTIMLTGWACRFKSAPRGFRQITGFMLEGDFTPSSAAIRQPHPASVCTLTPCEIAEAPWHEVVDVFADRPSLARAFQAVAAAEISVLQEWLTSLGRRPAEQRMAHLFCELQVRLQDVGLGGRTSYALPLTQATLGDALGLSPAHVNRTLQALRVRGLVVVEHGVVEIGDPARLQKFAGFNPRYLQASHRQAQGKIDQ